MSGRLVVDASAAVRVVLADAEAPVLIDALEAASVVIAPQLFASKVSSALSKYVRTGTLPIGAAVDRLDEALALVDRFEADAGLAAEALQASARERHPVYDLFYVVAARRHAARLLTRDRRLGELAQRLGVETV